MPGQVPFAKTDMLSERERAEYALAQLWQIPVFLIGVVALVLVWQGRHLWHESDAQQFNREFAAIRRELAQEHAELRKLSTMASDTLAQVECFPDRAAEAYFLAGSSYLRLSDDAAEPERTKYCGRARELLERADLLGVPPGDQAKLSYRLAKAWTLTEFDAQKIVDRLSPIVDESSDDSAEGYGMLIRALLRLPTPNLAAALDVSRKQLSQPFANDTRLADARLQQAEIFYRLSDPAQARAVLTRIGVGASPAVAARTRRLQAECCQTLRLWTEAIPFWQAVLSDAAGAGNERALVNYRLGQCYSALGKSAEALQAWERAASAGGEEAQAATLAQAELRFANGDFAGAIEAYGRALCDIQDATQYHNRLIALDDVRQGLQRNCGHLRNAGQYATALEIVHMFEKVAPAGQGQEQRAQIEAAWAATNRKAGRDAEARMHERAAGLAYRAVADANNDRAQQTQWLQQSARSFIDAQDYTEALATLKKLLALETAAAPLAEGWFTLGQVYERLQDELSAAAAYRKCIETDGPFAFRARYRLAEADIGRGKLEDAEKALAQNLALMRGAQVDDIGEKTLTMLTEVLCRLGKYRLATVHLQEALERFPKNPRRLQTRRQLADCYRQLASQEFQNNKLATNLPSDVQQEYWDKYYSCLKNAAEQYQKLAEDLMARKKSAALTADEEAMLRHADFALPECQLSRGQYEVARGLYESLAIRYQHRSEGLFALMEIYRCYSMISQFDNMRDTLLRLKRALEEAEPTAFQRRPTGEIKEDWDYRLTRNEWEEWIRTRMPPGRTGP